MSAPDRTYHHAGAAAALAAAEARRNEHEHDVANMIDAVRTCRRCRLPQTISSDHEPGCTWHPRNRA